MRVEITEEYIRIETNDGDMPIDHDKCIDWSCRLASIEAMAWAIRKLSDEMQKSVEFYRTGKHDNQISSIN
jgi:hypothetical protein